jgi:hypothetical protein
MRVTYKLTERDLLEAQGKHGGFWSKGLRIVGLFSAAVGLVSLAMDPKQYPGAVGAVFFGLFLAFGLRLLVRLSFRRDKRLQDQFEVLVSDSGMEVSSSTVTSKYGWSAFTRYVESKNLFLVYQASQVFNVIPKRAFTPEDLNSFRSMLHQNLGRASLAHAKRISPQTWIFLAVVAISAVLLAMVMLNNR